MKRWLIASALLLAAWTAPALAHKPSDSYLTLDVDGDTIDGQWDIALRDLDFALGLDANQDGDITWGEVKAKHAEIDAYALSRLRLGPAGAPCPASATEHLIDDHSDGAYAVMRFTATCAAAPKSLAVGYRLFFDIDPQHRGLLRLEYQGATAPASSASTRPISSFTLGASVEVGAVPRLRATKACWHIWTGFDHILFLLSLLLPAVLVRSTTPGRRWEPAASFADSFWDVVKVVTAFTLAHSITLSLAALGVVEPAVAAGRVGDRRCRWCLRRSTTSARSCIGSRWLIAFCFGLIHGFGFARCSTDLGLPQESLLIALVAFNLGVELGQLAIVGVFLPRRVCAARGPRSISAACSCSARRRSRWSRCCGWCSARSTCRIIGG